MSDSRRRALKILGTIGAGCVFPFANDELYGQHVKLTHAQAPAGEPYTPSFFTAPEFAVIGKLADVIIPATDTPGALGAGVPAYIDRVVSANREHHDLARAGVAWLTAQARRQFGADYLELRGDQHTALLQPLSDALDRDAQDQQRAMYRTSPQGRTYYVAVNDAMQPARPAVAVAAAADDRLPARFFRLVKNLTADGYYTSRIGLVDELGYRGNTYLGRFPGCTVAEH